MRRRDLVWLAGVSAAFWPFAVRAQRPGTALIGVLTIGSSHDYSEFHKGLKETGFVEGQNVAVEYRWTRAQPEMLRAMANELVARQPHVLVALGGPAAQALKAATNTIPIVFLINGDPVRAGLVSSFSHPGANVTGVTVQADDLNAKQLELLCEVLPNAKKIAVLAYPTPRGIERSLREAASTLQRDLHPVYAATEHDFSTALSSLLQLNPDALLIVADPLFTSYARRLGAITSRYRIPAVHYMADFAQGGGLLRYGYNLERLDYQAGVYVGRVLKGQSPAELPVQQASKAEIVVNVKTANALGLAIPPTLLARADEVIE
jgi:putative ABC transport system substrate-binding protein